MFCSVWLYIILPRFVLMQCWQGVWCQWGLSTFVIVSVYHLLTNESFRRRISNFTVIDRYTGPKIAPPPFITDRGLPFIDFRGPLICCWISSMLMIILSFLETPAASLQCACLPGVILFSIINHDQFMGDSIEENLLGKINFDNLIHINFRADKFSRTLAARNLKIFARINVRAPWLREIWKFSRGGIFVHPWFWKFSRGFNFAYP